MTFCPAGNPQNEPLVRKPIKLMKLHDFPITVATYSGRYEIGLSLSLSYTQSLLHILSLLVTGDSGGKIKFFDSDLKMVNWYDNTTELGPLASISFAQTSNITSLKKTM